MSVDGVVDGALAHKVDAHLLACTHSQLMHEGWRRRGRVSCITCARGAQTRTDGLEVLEHGIDAPSKLLAVVGAQVHALTRQGRVQNERQPLHLHACMQYVRHTHTREQSRAERLSRRDTSERVATYLNLVLVRVAGDGLLEPPLANEAPSHPPPGKL
jgi:hypothetical protein